MLGWIKLHRKILDNGIFTGDSDLLKVFVWSLLKASHKTHQVGVHTVNAGQFITGRISASQELNIKPTTVRNKLNQLQDKGYIHLLTTNKFSVVTISQWSAYQVEEQEETKVKTTIDERCEKFAKEVFAFTEYNQDMLNDFVSYWTEPNKSKTKAKFELQKTWSTARRLATWSKRSFPSKTTMTNNKPKSKISEGIDKWQKARQMVEQQNKNQNG